MDLIVNYLGQVICVYDEAIDLTTLGRATIMRASHVEPDEHGRWWADLGPVQGPKLGPYERRSLALAAELHWLEEHWLFGGKEQDDHGHGDFLPQGKIPQRPGGPDRQVSFRGIPRPGNTG